MREDLLNQLKYEFQKEREIIQKHNQRIDRIKQLKDEPLIQEYLELSKEVVDETKIDTTEEEIIEKLYRHNLYRIHSSDTNGIYIYFGTFDNHDQKVDYDSSSAVYRKYKNIELSYIQECPIEESKIFEKKNNILFPKNEKEEYFKIQKEFFKEAIQVGQPQAKTLILEKYKK